MPKSKANKIKKTSKINKTNKIEETDNECLPADLEYEVNSIAQLGPNLNEDRLDEVVVTNNENEKVNHVAQNTQIIKSDKEIEELGARSFSNIAAAEECIRQYNNKYILVQEDKECKIHGAKVSECSKDGPDKCNRRIGCKRFYVVKSFFVLYKMCVERKYFLYENRNRSMAIKAHFDFDIPLKKVKEDEYEGINETNFNETTMNNIMDGFIKMFRQEIKEYDITIDPEWVALDATTATKLSRHLIFTNIIFESIEHHKIFMSQWTQKIKGTEDYNKYYNKIVDPKIYQKGCFRLLWCSKIGNKNIFEYHSSNHFKYNKGQNDKELFFKTLTTKIGENKLPVSIETVVNNESHQVIQVVVPKIDDQISVIVKTAEIEIVGNKDNVFKARDDIDRKCYLPSMLKGLVKCLNNNRSDNRSDWINVGMALKNCNHGMETFMIWNEFSKKSNKYTGQNDTEYYWKSFRYNEAQLYNLQSLRTWARSDSPDLYNQMQKKYPKWFRYVPADPTILEPLKFNAITVNLDYVIDKQVLLKNDGGRVARAIIEFTNSKTQKILALKSTYNTGKTSLIHKLIEEYPNLFQRVLFVTPLRSLSNEIEGSYTKLGFKNYLNNNEAFTANRAIVSVDSLLKLVYYQQSSYKIPQYDLVILDEIESILNHFGCPTLRKKESVFALLRDIIFNSTKTIALDGDLHNRSFDFLNGISQNLVCIVNTKQKDLFEYTFMKQEMKFIKNIEQSLLAQERIVIVSMSSSFAHKLYALCNKRFPNECELYTSLTDDSKKNHLKNVTQYWQRLRVLIYSPTIQSGVSFDIEHFDRLFVVLSRNSTSQRGLMQMMPRVRKFKQRNVLVYLNGLSFGEYANFYQYDEIKDYVNTINDAYYSSVYDPELNKMIIKKYEEYDTIFYHNELENFNKSPYLFVPYLVTMMKQKGHTVSYDDVIENNLGKFKSQNITKNAVIAAPNINAHDYELLNKKQKDGLATMQEKLQIRRYIIGKSLNIENPDNETIKKYYNKRHAFRNWSHVVGVKMSIEQFVNTHEMPIDPKLLPKNKSDNDSDDSDDEDIMTLPGIHVPPELARANIGKFNRKCVGDAHSQFVALEKVKLIRTLINDLGFNVNEVNDKIHAISREEFIKNIDEKVKTSSLFKNSINAKIFGKSEFRFKQFIDRDTEEHSKANIELLNSILGNYGFKIERYVHNKKEKKKVIHEISYGLKVPKKFIENLPNNVINN